MSALEFPQRAADDIEWKLLSAGYDEVSRGDLQADKAFEMGGDVDAHSDDPGGQEIAKRTKFDQQIDDCFDHLEYRASTLSNSYLFRVRRDVVAKLAENETDANLVYRLLLACSRPELSYSLSSVFSELCKLALSRFLGGGARVWNVDAGSADRISMGGTTREVAKYLAPYLGASVQDDMIEHLPQQGGDGGVDLVACFSFEDRASGHLAVLGQCASSSSTDYWKDKLYQPIRFKNLYRWTAPPTLAAFVPVIYRTSAGKWLNEINVGEVLLFDRIRIIGAMSLDSQPLPRNFRRDILTKLDAAIAGAAKKKIVRKNVVKKTAVKKMAAKKAVAVRQRLATKAASKGKAKPSRR